MTGKKYVRSSTAEYVAERVQAAADIVRRLDAEGREPTAEERERISDLLSEASREVRLDRAWGKSNGLFPYTHES